MNRYGMKYSTIRYFQAQARDLRLLADLRPVGCFARPELLAAATPRAIARDAIAIAEVRTPEQLRQLLATPAPGDVPWRPTFARRG